MADRRPCPEKGSDGPTHAMTPTEQGANGSDRREDGGAKPDAGGRPTSRLGLWVSRAALAVALVAAISAASIWIAGRPALHRVEVLIPTPAPPLPVTVHVAGAVMRPGVYTLAPGARIDDAITAAGRLPDSDVHALNLAAPLTDGARIDVPTLRPGTAADERKAAAPGEDATPTAAATPAPGLIDLNTATIEQLQRLDGIGPVRGQAIIDYRQLHGPIERVDDLLDIRGIGEKTVDGIRGLVVQP